MTMAPEAGMQMTCSAWIGKARMRSVDRISKTGVGQFWMMVLGAYYSFQRARVSVFGLCPPIKRSELCGEVYIDR